MSNPGGSDTARGSGRAFGEETAQPEAQPGGLAAALRANPALAVPSFARSSGESYQSEGSGSRDEIAARLPPLVQDLKAKSPGCPYLHGSLLGKRLLYLGDTCCMHEAFMACCFAEHVAMVVVIDDDDQPSSSSAAGAGQQQQPEPSASGSGGRAAIERVVRDVQALIPGWCASLNLPAVNFDLRTGSALALASPAAPRRDQGGGADAGAAGGSDVQEAGAAGSGAADGGGTAGAGAGAGGIAGQPPAAPASTATVTVPAAPDEVDMVIGCNLFARHSYDAANIILGGIFARLVPGGELSCTEVLSDRRLGQAATSNARLMACGLQRTMYVEDFKRLARQNGFNEPRLLNMEPHVPADVEAALALGNAKLFRATIRMFKLPLDTTCEDFGQVAVYKGTIPDHECEYQLDVHHVFVTNQPKLVCGNTAMMLGDAWLRPHFEVQGDRSVHYGLFSGTSLLDDSKDKCCG